MKPTLYFLLLTSLLPLAAGAQTVGDSETAAHRPLNLSLPRDAARAPMVSFGTDAARDPVAENLRAAQVSGGPGRLPYGSGYEARRRGTPDREAGTAPHGGSGQGSGQGGGSGRGGMGRGR